MGEFSHSLAVVIGINQYSNGISLLHTAVDDAREVARILELEHKYDKVWLLLDEQASLQALQRLLDQDLTKHVQPNDRLLFYFAGHGIALNGDDGPEGFLIPQDAKLGDTKTYLSMPKLQASLNELPCRHFLGILDCCFAGAFRWSSTRKLVQVEQGIIHKERFDRFIQDPAWQTITSAAYDQTALDAFDLKSERVTTGKHSPFAAALIEALSGQADIYPAATQGRPAGDGVITATELYLYLRDRIEPPTEALRHRQTPGIWPLKKHDKGEYIFLTPGHVLNLPPAPPLDESKNPYRGLQSFEAEQNDLFFGRQALTQKLCEFVSHQPLSVVLGASGSGKSSLVKAGLIPYLKQQDAKAEQQQWQILPPMRPGESPFKALSNALVQENVPGFSIPEAESTSANEMLTQYVSVWSQQHPGMKLLLAIDQFEEVLTLCRDEKEREQFLNGLAQAVSNHSKQLRLVLTLRSDFEPQFQDETLKAHWNAARFVVSPMTRSELREAIEEPASKRVMYFQSDDPRNPLVDQLIDEVAEMPGALPLLSFTLSELYLKYLRRQKITKDRGESIDRAITEADYKELGGVVRSLTQRADQEYEAARQEGVDESTIRNVMLRMVAVSGGELTRRRVLKSELMYPVSKNELVQKLIYRFSEARLLVEGLDTENQEYVEPAHDQLVIGWGKIKNWLNERQEKVEKVNRGHPIQTWLTERSAKLSLPRRLKDTSTSTARPEAEHPLKVNLPLQRELTTAANHWHSKKIMDGNRQAVGFLWDGDPRLPQLEQTQQSEDNWFNQTEAQFVERSVTQKRWNIRIRWILVGTAFTVLSGIATSIWYQLQISQIREKSARVENLLQTDPVEGLALAIQAMGQNRSTPIVNRNILPEVQSSLLSAVQTAKERNRFQESGVVTAVAFSPDGRKVVSGNGCLRDLQGNEEPIKLKAEGSIYGISFSPDGTTIVGSVASKTATDTPQAQIGFWDTQGNPLPLPFQEARSPIVSAAFSPDGETIVSGHVNGSVTQWDKQGNQIRQFSQKHQSIVDRVAFSPDGQTMFSHSRDGIHKWNLQDGSSRFFPGQETDRGEMVDLSEGGDCRSARTASPPNGFALYGSYFSFSKNNRYMIDRGHKNYLITLPEGEEQAVDDPVASPLAISPDATSLVGLGEDGSIMLRNVNPDRVNNRADSEFKPVDQPFLSPNRSISNVAFSPDSKTIVTGGDFGDVRIWDVRGINPVKQLQFNCNTEDSCPSIAMSPDSQFIAIGDENGNITLLDSNGQSTGQSIETGKGSIASLEFSTSGQAVIAKTTDQSNSTMWSIWDIKGNEMRQFNTKDPVVVSPDGKRAIQFSSSGITLLNSEGKPLGQPVKHPEFFSGNSLKVALSPDGQQLISFVYNINGSQGLNSNELTCLWTVRANSLVPKELPEGREEGRNCQETSLISFAAFSPDGETVALAASTSNNSQNTVSLWDLKSNQIGRPFQAPNVTSLAFSPDGETIASRGFDGAIHLSNLQGIPIGRPLEGRLEGYSIKDDPQRTIAFSPDGKNLMSVSSNGMVQQWTIGSEQLLQVACNRLQYHPVLNNPTTNAGKGAKETCEKYVWNSSGDSQSAELVSVASSIPTAPSLPCNEPSPLSLPSQKPGYYRDGEYYGPIEEISTPDGQLTLIFQNGNRYDGKFANGKRNGCGIFTFANGNRYAGEFVDDKFYGQGEFSWKGIEFYRGEFSDGKCHGQGTLTLADGTSKTGEWQNGNLIGGSSNDSCNR